MSRWRVVDGVEAAALDTELQREIVDGHPLYARTARAVARRRDGDDVAFEVEGAGLCVVHLTWGGPGDARWPSSFFVDRLPEEE